MEACEGWQKDGLFGGMETGKDGREMKGINGGGAGVLGEENGRQLDFQKYKEMRRE